MNAVRIDIPGEGVTVTATCGDCHEPLARASGWVSWRCDTEECWVRIIPMFEDARFVDDDGTVWIECEDGDGWIDVVNESPVPPDCPFCRYHSPPYPAGHHHAINCPKKESGHVST